MICVSLGCDHAGYELKNSIVNYLNENNISVIDCGTHDSKSCDYPDIAHKTVGYLIEGEVDFSILICGSGVGMAMCANHWRPIRAALCWNKEVAELSRQHNNANTLCLPARFIEEKEALEMVKIFLSTEFEGGRHEKRVDKIIPIM